MGNRLDVGARPTELLGVGPRAWRLSGCDVCSRTIVSWVSFHLFSYWHCMLTETLP